MQLCSILVVASVLLVGGVRAQDDEALRECANLHRIEIQHIPNAKGSFENSKCLLSCTVGGQPLSTDPINEGFACPADPTGKCHNGLCVGGDAALVECGKLHHLDFKKVNNKGTEYSNSLCTLACAIDGNLMSTNAEHEGAACPGNSKGVCRKGTCVVDGSTPDPNIPNPTNPTNPGNEPTTEKPGGEPVTEPVGPTVPTTEIFSKVKLDEVEIKIKPGKFTADIERAYADVCLSNSDKLEGEFCKQICYSNEVSGTTKEPAWSKDCSAMKAYDDQTFLYVAVYAKADERFVGNVHESLNQLFAQHYTAASTDAVQFERQFPVKYFDNVVGHIGLDVKIKFSKK